MYQHFGLLSALTLFIGLLFIIKNWPYGVDHTFSQHVARHNSAIIYYIFLFGLTLPILLIFFFRWFIPTFELTRWFGVLVLGVSAAQFACTLVPETGGIKSTIHRGLAFLSADTLVPMLLILVFNSYVSALGKVVSVLALSMMIAIIYVMVKNNAKHRYLLFLQSTYFSVFFLAILTITYTS